MVCRNELKTSELLSGVDMVMLQGNDAYSFRRNTIYVWNVAVGSSCLLLVTISILGIAWRVLVAARLHKTW